MKTILFLLLIAVTLNVVAGRATGQTTIAIVSSSDSAEYNCPMRLDTLSHLTIEAWVRQDSTSEFSNPIFFGDDSDGFGFHFYTNLTPGFPDPLVFTGNGDRSFVTGTSIRLPLATWVHIAVTRSDSIWCIYRNGMLAGRGRMTPHISKGYLRLGRFFGALAEVRVWSTTHTPEQIRSMMFTAVNSNSPDLYAIFRCSSPLINTIVDSTHGYVFVKEGPPDAMHPIACPVSFGGGHMPTVSWKRLPAHLQFFPRQVSGYGRIEISGTILEPGFDSLLMVRNRNDQQEFRQSFALHYIGSSADFQFRDSILAEKALYSYSIYCKRKDTIIYVAECADLVAGDIYLISGQSNAHYALGWFYWQVPYLRSFGVQTTNFNFDPYDPADTLWGLANCSGWGRDMLDGPYLTGIWGMRLQQDILQTYGIPVCIINGAAGGSVIRQHERNQSDPTDLSSIYGKLLYRTQKANCQNDIKAIFWDQGEYDSATGYYDEFKKLYANWQNDYHIIGKPTYVLQVRPGCGPSGAAELREIQRDLSDSFPSVEVMSSVGVRGHDGCHYDAFGYIDIGDHFFHLVATNIYRSLDYSSFHAPNVGRVFYSKPDSAEITIVARDPRTCFSRSDDTVVGTRHEALKDYFFIDGAEGNVASIDVNADTIVLHLSAASHGRLLSYLPDKYYSDTAAIYEGPWITNCNGIGLLTFWNVPIQPFEGNIPNLVHESTEKPDISITYFPELHKLIVKGATKIDRVDFFDEVGRKIESILPSGNPTELKIDTILQEPGMHFLRVSTSKGSIVFPF